MRCVPAAAEVENSGNKGGIECQGASVGTKNQGYPDEVDLQNVRAFARRIAALVIG